MGMLKRAILIILSPIVLFACGGLTQGASTGEKNAKANISIKLPKEFQRKAAGSLGVFLRKGARLAAGTATVTSINYAITAPDISEITGSISLATLNSSVSLVGGTGRTFTVNVKLSTGSSFTGATTLDAPAGVALNVPISISYSDLAPTTAIIATVGGGNHTLALRSDGTVWAWGNNTNGQLGNNQNVDSAVPVQVVGLAGVTAIAAGGHHSVALNGDGTIWTWGFNSSGQLGDNSIADSSFPVQVQGLTGMMAVSAGLRHSLALKNDGTVWAWGYNSNGQLGNNTTGGGTASADSLIPVQVQGLTGITAVAAGANGLFSLALKSDGTVWAWGLNASGQLGNNSTFDSAVPVQVIAAPNRGKPNNKRAVAFGTFASFMLTGVTAIVCGNDHAFALMGNGTVLAWGLNTNGQLGDGTILTRYYPVQAGDLGGIKAVSAGGHTLALKNDGTVMAWGSNSYGQIGNNTTGGGTASADSLVPVSVLTGVTSIGAGSLHSIAIKSDGTISAWGLNGNGQLGNNAYNAAGEPSPVQTIATNIGTSAVSAPTGVTATQGSGQVTLSWTPVTGATWYNVYYGTSPNINPLNGTTITGGFPGLIVTGLANDKAYYFVVTTVDANGNESPPSITTSAVLISVTAPTGVTVTPGSTTLVVSWTAVTGAASYNVYYGTGSNVMQNPLGIVIGVSGTTNTINTLTNGTTYYVVVASVDATGYESVASASIGSAPVAPTAPPPSAPTGVTAVSGDSQITISWAAVSGATSYTVYWSNSSGLTKANGTPITGVAVTNYTHTPLTNGTVYYYLVTATDVSGESADSAVANAKAGAGVSWTARTSGIATNLNSVAWSGGMLAAVGAESTNRILFSSDGITWSAANVASTNVSGNALYNIVWAGAAGFRSVGANGTHDYSPDGITWYSRPSLPAWSCYAFAYSGSQYVVVGQTTTLLSSPNAIAWTAQTDPTGWGYDMFAAIWSGAQFVTGGVAGTLLTSPDGVTWTSRTTPSGNNIKGIAWSGTQFVAVITFGGIITSPDGITWTAQTSGTANALNAVNWNGTQFLAVGAAGTVLTSPDGITWTAQVSGTANALNGITWDGTQYVVVGAAGTILTSP